jgi:DNA-binding PadR family transcriptional regulator
MVINKLADQNRYMSKDMRHIVLKLLILKSIKNGKTYSYALVKKFSNDRISGMLQKKDGEVKNDIYNTINALEKSGYIKAKSGVNNERSKKYYTLTSSGKATLAQTKRIFLSSMKSLMEIMR